MGSHSVACHPAEVTFPPLTQTKPAEAGTRLSDPGGMQGWVDLITMQLNNNSLMPPYGKSFRIFLVIPPTNKRTYSETNGGERTAPCHKWQRKQMAAVLSVNSNLLWATMCTEALTLVFRSWKPQLLAWTNEQHFNPYRPPGPRDVHRYRIVSNWSSSDWKPRSESVGRKLNEKRHTAVRDQSRAVRL